MMNSTSQYHRAADFTQHQYQYQSSDSSMVDSPQRPTANPHHNNNHNNNNTRHQGGQDFQAPIQFSWYDTPINPNCGTMGLDDSMLNQGSFHEQQHEQQQQQQQSTNQDPIHFQPFSHYLTSDRLNLTTKMDSSYHNDGSGGWDENQHFGHELTPHSLAPSPSNIAQLLSVTNAHIEHLSMDYTVVNEMIGRLQNELATLTEAYEAETRLGLANMTQEVNYMSFNGENSNDEYNGAKMHFSERTIKSHRDYSDGRRIADDFTSQVTQDRNRNETLRQEFCVDLQRQLDELRQRQIQIEADRQRAEAMRLEQLRIEQEQHRQQQLAQAQREREAQIQQLAHQQAQQQLQLQQRLQQQQQQQQQQNHPLATSNRSRHHNHLISPTQQLQSQQHAFGLDAKLVHFYSYNYLFVSLCLLNQSGRRCGEIQNTPAHISELATLAALWSFQAINTADFPSHMFAQLNSDIGSQQGIFDPENVPETAKLTLDQKLKQVSDATFTLTTPMKIGDTYSALLTNMTFFAQFTMNPPNDSIQGKALPYLKPLLSQQLVTFITLLQQAFNFNAILDLIDATIIPSAGKLSKTYISIGQTISRFGGVLDCQANLQNPSRLPLTTYHPSISLLVIVKFYHELLDSTQDAYLLGMSCAFLAQTTPFFHFLTIGSLLHSHRHLRTQSTPAQPAVLNQLNSATYKYTTRTRSCTLPACACLSPSVSDLQVGFIQARIGFLTAYSQSITPRNNGLQVDEYLFQQDLGNLRRNVPHPMTTINNLRTILNALHVDFAYFTHQHGSRVAKFDPHPGPNPNPVAASLAEYYTLGRHTSWELCSCCGYNTLPPETLSSTEFLKLNPNVSPHSPYSDPHWSFSTLTNQPQSTKFFNHGKGLPVLAAEGSTLEPPSSPHICPYPTLFPFTAFTTSAPPLTSQEANSLFQRVSAAPFPPELLPTTAPNTAIPTTLSSRPGNPKHAVVMGNKIRLEFLWSWYAQLLNLCPALSSTDHSAAARQPIAPAFIPLLLVSLQSSGFQLRYTYGAIGHHLLEFIYHEILMKQQKALTTKIDPATSKPSAINAVEYNLLIDEFTRYRNGENVVDDDGVCTVRQPNTTFPFDKDKKVIQANQSSNTAVEVLAAGGDHNE